MLTKYIEMARPQKVLIRGMWSKQIAVQDNRVKKIRFKAQIEPLWLQNSMYF